MSGPSESSTALEIEVNKTRERDLLSLEVSMLEAQWRREGEIAAIADRELS